MPRRVARRLSRILGRRGAFLASFGTLWALYGFGQLVEPLPDTRGIRLLLNLMPLDAWACCWIVSGLLAVASSALPEGRDWLAFPALLAIVVPWMLAYLVSWWPLGDNARGWVTALIWAVAAVPVIVVAGWREPPRPKNLE
ncbi:MULTISPECIES: hypothetical protein [Streptomyces]|uniref:Integral membrane protein n=1 Tax=Streptomyces venezuelae (strain ATCC 10712 / CBS 650.69 / DSM 40230 / JCM 4526 / NBRC 13096 / PD 04745) TaxID=953739 RepID=F2R0T2_STRVP|nr:hypothetical protein [Streptomyces venezuelae]APE21423.1 hypothetical protein vnz_10565 [Streptomyces venezuelae]QER98810.1 hypothetical protein DEJ43_10710 [Streptomyces venezuelae ATCC 10712]CCA55449.1 hypothetical protein SVEN_2163 [Streptomyces venezuelae ATCC 10712]